MLRSESSQVSNLYKPNEVSGIIMIVVMVMITIIINRLVTYQPHQLSVCTDTESVGTFSSESEVPVQRANSKSC